MSSHIQKRKADDFLEKTETKSLKVDNTLKFHEKLNTIYKKMKQLGIPEEIITYAVSKAEIRGYSETHYTELCEIEKKLNKTESINVDKINQLSHDFNDFKNKKKHKQKKT